jgi:hypothetical protein
LGGSVKDSLRALSHEILPGLSSHEERKLSTDTAGKIGLHQLDLAALGWSSYHLTPALHGCKIQIGEDHFIRGTTKSNQRHLSTGSRTQHQRAPRGLRRAQTQSTPY